MKRPWEEFYIPALSDLDMQLSLANKNEQKNAGGKGVPSLPLNCWAPEHGSQTTKAKASTDPYWGCF